MKHKTTFILLLICLTAHALAADDPIDVLRHKLARESGSERMAVVRDLIAALTARGDGEQAKENFKASLANYLEALELLKKNGGGSPSPRLLNHTGMALLVLGDYERALGFLLRALTAAERMGDREFISASAYLIGYVHRDLKNFDLALKYLRMAYDSGLALGNQRRVIMSLNEIGNVYVYREKFSTALPYKEKSLAQAREYGDPVLLANSLNDMGTLYLSQDKAAQALPYLQEALAIYRKLSQVRGIIIALLSIGDAQRRLGRFSATLVSLDEARALAEKSGHKKDLAEILLLYSYTFEGMHEYHQALACHRRYQELWEQIFNEDKTKQTTDMQTRYEVEKKQRENELLKQEKEIASLALAKERNQRNFLFFLALLVMLLAAVLYSRFLIKARSNRELEAANDKIGSQQARLEEAYRSMENLARRDQLTGLPNRRVALEEIDREEKRFQRSKNPFALIMTDIDGFKAVNDTAGHDAGDHVLRSMAELFSQSLRAQDMVYRWGGDEFLFLLPETGLEGAGVFMAAVREKVRGGDFIFNGRRLLVTVSMGAGVYADGLTVEECLRRADQEMYRSRQHR